MRLYGNKFATQLTFTPTKDPFEIHYGSCPLLTMGDSDKGNYIELGYNTARVDMGTRFIFYTPEGIDGLENLPNPTLTYMPSFASGLAGLDDVPIISGAANVDWSADTVTASNEIYGTMYRTGEGDASILLGRYNKPLWIDSGDGFLVEFLLNIQFNSNDSDLINLAFDENKYSGFRIQNYSFFGLRAQWGDGTQINSLGNSSVLPDFSSYYHIGFIFDKVNDRASLYFDGELIDYEDSPNALYNELMYSGVVNSTLFDKIAVNAVFSRVCVGDYTPADFAYHLYLKDGYGNYQTKQFIPEKNVPNSFYMDWSSAEKYTEVHIFNPDSKPIEDYYAIVSLPNPPASGLLSFEDANNRTLRHFEFDNSFYVEIPNIASSGVATIYAVEHNPNSNVSGDENEMCLFNGFASSNNPKWLTLGESGIDGIVMSDTVWRAEAAQATTMQLVEYDSSLVKEAYVLKTLDYDIPERGYRVLFGHQNYPVQYSHINYSGLSGITLEADSNSMAETLNLVLGYSVGTESLAGVAVAGDTTTYDEYANWTSSNTTFAHSGVTYNYYDIKVTKDRILTATNLTTGGSIGEIDINSMLPGGDDYTARFGFWMGKDISGEQFFHYIRMSKVYFLEYYPIEPLATIGRTYTANPEVRVFLNGKQQF